MWWGEEGPKSKTELTTQIEKEMRNLIFDFIVDEPMRTIFVLAYENAGRKENFYEIKDKKVLPTLWLVLTNIDTKKGFNFKDIRKIRKDPNRKIRDRACYQYPTAVRKFLGSTLGEKVLPRRKTPYRPKSENFSCCWLLSKSDPKKSVLLHEIKPLEKE